MKTITLNLVDFTYLESLIGDDNETKQIILSTLIEEVPDELIKLARALRAGDMEEFHSLSHKLKSTLAYIGNERIFEANQNMMLASRENRDLDQIPLWFSEVEELWCLIEPEIQMALDSL